MKLKAVIFAATLIAIGVVGYVATGAASVTALIPAFFGVAVFLAIQWKSKGIVLAVVLAVLGLAGAARGLPGFLKLITGETVERPAAAISQAIMSVVCLAFIIAFFTRGKSAAA